MHRLLVFTGLLAACSPKASPAVGPLAPTPSSAASLEPRVGEESINPGINDNFLNPDLDVAQWVKRFEGESREVFANRGSIVDALELRPGMAIADIGAGTGLFEPLFADRVGEEGTVYAVDISPQFLDHLRERAAATGLGQIVVVEGTERSVQLDAGSVDLVFVCDTYHHFEYPRATLASIHDALRPGGSLVVVDFERIEGESRDWILSHVRGGKEVFGAEIEAAGFEEGVEVQVGLEENYMMRFRRL